MRQKNCSKIVPFRSIKRYLLCRLFLVSSGNTVRFSRQYLSIPFCFVSFRFISFVRLHNGASHLASGGYAHFRKQLSEASVHRQEAARAYKRGCEAVSSPSEAPFLDEQDRCWTLCNTPQSIQNGTERNETKQNSMRMIWDIVRQHCTPVSCTFFLYETVLNRTVLERLF